jgi:ornithine cyclodeaminase
LRYIAESELESLLDYPSLVKRLREAFRGDTVAPQRLHYGVPGQGGAGEGTLLLMPAWRSGGAMGVKIATVFPTNTLRDLPAVFASYLLLDAATGEPRALLDGTTLTRRRTAAASALAATYLARPDSRRLLIVGTGALAPHLVLAHAAVRPIREVLVWGRSFAKAAQLESRLAPSGLRVSATNDLEGAARSVDVISCATLASEPLIQGEWLAPGVHLDLVGGFTPAMREADDEAVRRARLFVDTRSGALREAGDIVQPVQRGVVRAEDVAADLFDLARAAHPGRTASAEITLFKSVGSAIEDLAAAELAFERVSERAAG